VLVGDGEQVKEGVSRTRGIFDQPQRADAAPRAARDLPLAPGPVDVRDKRTPCVIQAVGALAKIHGFSSSFSF
jgi:hypothetical protein